MTALRPGDASFARSFTRVDHSECGSFRRETRFSAGKGRKFVTMVLGAVDAKETFADVEKLLNELRFYRQEPAQHPDDAAVDRFASAMKAKLAAARAKGRHGWEDPEVCSVEFLSEQLVEHVAKGNAGTFEDIANFAMVLHQRGADPATLAGVFRCMLPGFLPKEAPFTFVTVLDGKVQRQGSEHHCQEWAGAWNTSVSESAGRAEVWPMYRRGHAAVGRLKPVLAMILQALDRDALDGHEVRGEMAQELRTALEEVAQ